MLVPLGEPGGAPRVVTADDGRRFAVFPLDGGFRVTDAECPHNRGAARAKAGSTGRTLVCPWHWYRFDLDSGVVRDLPPASARRAPRRSRWTGRGSPTSGRSRPTLSWSERLRAHARYGSG